MSDRSFFKAGSDQDARWCERHIDSPDEATSYVLRETLASKRQDKPIYFEKMVAIGPCCTSDPSKAARFESREEAMQCPAYYHSLSFFEPEPAPPAEVRGSEEL